MEHGLPIVTNKLLCLGMGYVATALALRLSTDNWSIAATCTTPAKRQVLESKGYAVALFSREYALPPSILEGVTHLVSSIPPDENGDLAGEWLAANVAQTKDVQWAALLSTTGVYGDHAGTWVEEDADLRPTNLRSIRRAAAEADWRALQNAHAFPAHIFRLAGIYGPGRNPLDRVRDGTARRIVKPGLMLSRIHRDDILGSLSASIEMPNPGEIYNVADNEPAPPQDVVAFGCALLGVVPPTEEVFETAAMSPMARSFYADNKKIRNDRLKRDLCYRLIHPTYREGLTALLAECPQ